MAAEKAIVTTKIYYMKMRPNYSKIYHDLLQAEYPEKLKDVKVTELLQNLNTSDEVIKFNEKLFKQSKESLENNQKLRTYDRETMLKILMYQKQHGFSSNYISKKYKISRTTIAKWKKICEDDIQ
ncbi:helix-turn-helix domain-containing protein [Chryseobacterium sp. 09-1422]|jgi:response regulator of citrate/malate metabolism|uniref:Helix-turn-helix domain-containing protein n=1 Tax=Chryseobacterium kimseyorum TaxID=2984028 RepID=A0ABT3HZ74_9FLAO|nr:helix-turn-helix domain-containing protein [Chryseobacterium kimseyorum]MCW3169093.1 helix-turn-helix domain-containing protein [Chryseobacterium kimseyorum]